MSEVSAAISMPSLEDTTATVFAHRTDLGLWSTGSHTEVLSNDVAAAIRSELAAVIDRGSSKQIAVRFGAKLLAAYPARASDTQDDLRAYAALVLEELQRFSPEILAAGLPKFWRTHTFRPSVGEISIFLDGEVELFRRLRHGFERMELQRAAIEAERVAAEVRAEAGRARAAADDAEAVRQFGSNGVQPGDYRGAMRLFMLIRPARQSERSPWLRWVGLLRPGQDWPKRLALPMRRGGIFGRAQLGWAREQATIDELAMVQKHLIDGDEQAARDLVGEIERRPVDPAKASKVDPDRLGTVPPEVTALAEAFRDLLIEPVACPEATS